MENLELKPTELRPTCDPKLFDFTSTADVDPLDDVIGQKRAVQAIDFGLKMNSPGYNIFVTGIEGTGKSTIVQDIINKHARELPEPCDWCMVNNFEDEYRPITISVPMGQATQFAKRMGKLVDDLKGELPKTFQSDSFQERQKEIQKGFGKKNRTLFTALEKIASEQQIMIKQTQAGFETIPLKEGKPLPGKEFAALPQEEKEAIGKRIEAIQGEIETTVREVNKINQAMGTAMEEYVGQVALFVVKQRIDPLRELFSEASDILKYLDAVQADIVENVDDFLPAREAPAAMEQFMAASHDPFQKYAVNILVDRRGCQGAPVVFETNPNFYNVFGRIEKRAQMGTVTTHFSMVQAGSLLRANGGFLILEIESVLMYAQVWEALKRALQNKQLFLEDPPTEMGRGSFSLRPQPIPLEVKVVLVGGYSLFQMLQNHDSKFNKIFKVRADFDAEVKRDATTIQQYARLVSRACRENGLKDFTPEGVAALADQGVRLAGDKDKLSIRFGPLIATLKESHYWAAQEEASLVTAEHVERALREHRFRYNLYEEKIHQSYVDGSILLDVEGAEVGQVNALAVYQIGDISFGRPSRITAETYLGKRGVINIEREAKLSGKTHDKGVLILSGFLGRTFAQERPLSLAISITFEQNYGGIDGDSASSTELYAILSSLSGIPIRQGVAVTGSVNQKGEIQAIGGANEKIEGFFDVCREKGLNGNQGVMIPKANVKNLMLKPSVVGAVRSGQFRIWAVATVAEGIEVLTGKSAGQPDETGGYPPDSIFGRVQRQLDEYHTKALLARKAGKKENEDYA